VLWRAHRLAQQTDGAFDPTIGVLVRLWREARRTGLGLTQLILARVRARDGITADSLATAAAVLGTAGIPHLQRLYKGVQIEVQEA